MKQKKLDEKFDKWFRDKHLLRDLIYGTEFIPLPKLENTTYANGRYNLSLIIIIFYFLRKFGSFLFYHFFRWRKLVNIRLFKINIEY